jgi:hypothetical protein
MPIPFFYGLCLNSIKTAKATQENGLTIFRFRTDRYHV